MTDAPQNQIQAAGGGLVLSVSMTGKEWVAVQALFEAAIGESVGREIKLRGKGEQAEVCFIYPSDGPDTVRIMAPQGEGKFELKPPEGAPFDDTLSRLAEVLKGSEITCGLEWHTTLSVDEQGFSAILNGQELRFTSEEWTQGFTPGTTRETLLQELQAAGQTEEKPTRRRRKAPPAISLPVYFKAPVSHQPIRSAFAHAGEGRGTEEIRNEQSLMILAPIKSRKKSGGQLAYQTSLYPELTSCTPHEWIRQSLGLKAVSISLGLECYYGVRGDHNKGTVAVWPEYLLSLLGRVDRPENRHRIFEVLTALAALKVYHSYTTFEAIPTARPARRGRTPSATRPVTRYGYRPYITLEPLTSDRTLEPHEAIRAIEEQKWEVFDGLLVKFAEPQAFDRAFYPMPTSALKLGSRKGAGLRELQALALGDALIRQMAMDWNKYGGRLQAPLYPSFAHGQAGNWNHAQTQGILHLAGLSSERRPTRREEALPEVLECARQADLCGIVDLDIEHNKLSVTAPLWLWDLMQDSRRAYRGEEPEYVTWLRKQAPELPG